jgi:hypothetical protein
MSRHIGDSDLFWKEFSETSDTQHHQHQHQVNDAPQNMINHTTNQNTSDAISIANSSVNYQDDGNLGSFIDMDRCWLNDEGKNVAHSNDVPNYASISSNSLIYRSASISSRKTIVPSLAQISLSALDSDSESMFSGSAWSGFSRDTTSNTSSVIYANRHAPHHSLRTMMAESITYEQVIDKSVEGVSNISPDQTSNHAYQRDTNTSSLYGK